MGESCSNLEISSGGPSAWRKFGDPINREVASPGSIEAFGPGFLASLHLAAAFAPEVAFELFFGDLEASPYHDAVRARQGRLSVPPGPGLGLDPDMEVLNCYRLGPPVVIES